MRELGLAFNLAMGDPAQLEEAFQAPEPEEQDDLRLGAVVSERWWSLDGKPAGS